MLSIIFGFALFVGVCRGASVPGPARIAGGSPTTIQEYPSIVQIETFRSGTYWGHTCGGSILTNNLVLSAGHCFPLGDASQYRIRAGATDREIGGVINPISSILIHPDYFNATADADGDICLVRLGNLLVFGNTINSIPILPQDWVVPGNSPATYAGWGFLGGMPWDVKPDVLQYIDVNIVSHEECEERYGFPLEHDLICAGFPDRAICSGDSGGPLYYAGILAGVIVFGPGDCAHPYIPGASIRTASYSDWIVANQ